MSDQLRGVLFRNTIRGGHSSLAIIATSTSDDEEWKTRCPQKEERMVLVIVRMGGPEWKKQERDENDQSAIKESDDQGNEMSLMRSNIRRMCKLGNEMEFRGHFAESTPSEAANNTQTPSTDWNTWDKFVVDYYLPTSSQSHQSNLRVCQELKWDATQCQTTRAKYFVSPPKKQQAKKGTNKSNNNAATNPAEQIIDPTKKQSTTKDNPKQSNSRHFGGGIGKRKQGEIVADFLLWMLSTIHDETKSGTQLETHSEQSASNNDELQSTSDTFHKENDLQQQQPHLFMERWVPLHPSLASPKKKSLVATKNTMVEDNQSIPTPENTIDMNNSHQVKNENVEKIHPYSFYGGIIDAAGGAGHVSLALALRGVHSTVVDPRSTVGKLPGRDRKVMKKSNLPPFSTYRAWFGSRPKGVDSFYREGNASDDHEYNQTFATIDGNFNSVKDPTTLPICSMCSEDNLLSNCMAIVALHPDEATGSIIETAVENEIPFVAVPCCVFSRLFPERIKHVVEDESGSAGESNATVSTYYDLIDWLVAKHPAIKVTRLPFEGANIAVWATFK